MGTSPLFSQILHMTPDCELEAEASEIYELSDFEGKYERTSCDTKALGPNHLRITFSAPRTLIVRKGYFNNDEWQLGEKSRDITDPTMRDRGWNELAKYKTFFIGHMIVTYRTLHHIVNCVNSYRKMNKDMTWVREMQLMEHGETLIYRENLVSCSYKRTE